MRRPTAAGGARRALARLHVQIDDPPHLIDDEVGLALADPEDGWRDRPDMHPTGTGPSLAAIVARAQVSSRTSSSRRASASTSSSALVSTPTRSRLDVPEHLHLVPVDFESNDDWWAALADARFNATARALVSSSGVSMYITKAATAATLDRLARTAPRSIVVMTFMFPFART